MKGLDNQTKKVKSWVNCQAQRVMVRGSKLNLRSVMSAVLWGSTMDSILYYTGSLPLISISDLDSRVECTLSTFSDDPKLGRVDSPYCHIAIQTDLNRLERWDDRSLKKVNEEKCKFLYMGRKKSSMKSQLCFLGQKIVLQ